MKKIDDSAIDLERVEDKYIVPKEDFVETKHLVETHLPAYFPQPETIYCLNTSIYFDSPDLTFLKQHLNKLDSRRKIRIRTYAPNGVASHIYYIEIKSKNDGTSTKTRLQISPEMFDEVMKTSQIPTDERILIANEDMDHDEVLKQAKLINYLMLVNKVKPVVEVTYKRYAYQQDENFRVTMDQQIKVKPLQLFNSQTIKGLQNEDLWDELKEYGESFSNAENFLLEVKYHTKTPPWFDDLIKKLDVEKEAFSKYVWAMYAIFNNTLKIVRK